MSEQRCPECDEPLLALRHKPLAPICPNPDCGWPNGEELPPEPEEQQPEYDAGWGWVLGGQA